MLRKLEELPGVTVDRRGDHARVFRGSKLVTTLPSTPSDRRWLQNTLAALKRGGIHAVDTPRRREEVAVATPEVHTSDRGQLVPIGTSAPTSPVETTAPTPATSRGSIRPNPNDGRFPHEADMALVRSLILNVLKQMGYPNKKGARARFVRYVMRFSETYEGQTWASAPSLEQSLHLFLQDKGNGLSLWGAELMFAATMVYDEEEDALAQAKWEGQLAKKRAAQLSKIQEAVAVKKQAKAEVVEVKEEPVEKVAEMNGAGTYVLRNKKLADELIATLDELRVSMGRKRGQHVRFGKGTIQEFSKKVLRESRKRGVPLRASTKTGGKADAVLIAKRVGDYALRHDESGTIMSWQELEIAKYLALWNGTEVPEEVEQTKAPHRPAVARQPVNKVERGELSEHEEALFDLIEGKLLNREQLNEASRLAAALVEFRSNV